jgi:hypothetical protein
MGIGNSQANKIIKSEGFLKFEFVIRQRLKKLRKLRQSVNLESRVNAQVIHIIGTRKV